MFSIRFGLIISAILQGVGRCLSQKNNHVLTGKKLVATMKSIRLIEQLVMHAYQLALMLTLSAKVVPKSHRYPLQFFHRYESLLSPSYQLAFFC